MMIAASDAHEYGWNAACMQHCSGIYFAKAQRGKLELYCVNRYNPVYEQCSENKKLAERDYRYGFHKPVA